MSLKRCLDEGVLQSYLDGELSPDRHDEAEAHLTACALCAHALQEAASELSMFTSAFAHEAALGVPSETLRERIEAAIADKHSSQTQFANASTEAGWNLKNWLAGLAASFSLSPSRAMALASFAAVVAFAVVFGIIISRHKVAEREQLAANDAPTSSRTTNAKVETTQPAIETSHVAVLTPPASTEKRATAAAAPKVSESRPARYARPVPARAKRALPASSVPKAEPVETLLPGEADYLKSIASLSSVIKAGGDVLMRPALRADFERNLAVVDQAIRASRSNVLRNPKDKDAAKFLFSAYQSKVELLSAVADQAQVATLGR